jgi:hypothetical protein
LWDNVTIKVTGNANILNTSQRPDFSAMFGATERGTQSAKQGVIIDPTITRAISHITTAVTPHTAMGDPSQSNRRKWPAVLTADLQVSNNHPSGNARVIRLHAAKELSIGRCPLVTDKKSGRVYTNDIVTDFAKEDDPQLSPEQLEKRRAAISRVNSALTISADALAVRNTGSPGSESSGYTEVRYRAGQKAVHVVLTDRGEERLIEGIRDGQVTAVQLAIGGSQEESGPIHGYPLQLIPVPLWQDNDTNSWPHPEEYVELLWNLPSLCRDAPKHGMDSVLIKHQVSRDQPLPLHVMLLRQLWLGMDGMPLENLRADRPRDAAAVRVLIASHEAAREKIFLMQPLQEQHTLLVQSATHQRPMRVRPRDLVPLHHGDHLRLEGRNGKLLWEAKFSVISPETT